jgi:hypothetical protein
MMRSELILSAAAEAVAAASILFDLSMNASAASASGAAAATAPATTKLAAIESVAADSDAKPKSVGAATKITIAVGAGERLASGCVRVNLVVGNRRLKSLVAVRCKAVKRPEGSLVNERVVPQSESVESVVVESATELLCGAPAIVSSSDEDDDDRDLPSREDVGYSSSFSTASFAASAGTGADADAEDDDDDDTDDETPGKMLSSEKRLVYKSSGEDDDDLPPLEEVKDSSSAYSMKGAAGANAGTTARVFPSAVWSSTKQVAVAKSCPCKVLEDCFPPFSEIMDKVRPMMAQMFAENWQERLRRRGRGARYAEIIAAVRPTPRGQGGGGGGGGGGGRQRRRRNA